MQQRLTASSVQQVTEQYFFARMKEERELKSTEGELRWIAYEEVPGLDMPASAKHMILHYLKEGRYTDCLYGGVAQEGGTEFVVLREF